VDLTNTSRYYSSSEVSRRDGTKYVKMAMEGRGRTLPPSEINKFVDMCDDVNAGDEGAIVGVHCTHGFNRTGYLICTYLILRRGYGVEQALLEFRDKRPPGIYRPEYVRELLKLHGAANPEIFGVFSPYWDKKDEIKGGLDPRKFRMEEFPYPELKVRFEFHLTEVLRDFNRAMGKYF
jgi:mRNA-capping enzyme